MRAVCLKSSKRTNRTIRSTVLLVSSPPPGKGWEKGTLPNQTACLVGPLSLLRSKAAESSAASGGTGLCRQNRAETLTLARQGFVFALWNTACLFACRSRFAKVPEALSSAPRAAGSERDRPMTHSLFFPVMACPGAPREH